MTTAALILFVAIPAYVAIGYGLWCVAVRAVWSPVRTIERVTGEKQDERR